MSFCAARCVDRRSTELDKWTPDELKAMVAGGNEAARQFFRDKGWTDMTAKVCCTSSWSWIRRRGCAMSPFKAPQPSSPWAAALTC